MTTRAVKEWFSPGIVINLIGLLVAACTTIGVYMHRADVTDNNIAELKATTSSRFQKMEDRMDGMQRDGQETIRLEERVQTLQRELERQDRILQGISDISQARYDSINTRLARKGL